MIRICRLDLVVACGISCVRCSRLRLSRAKPHSYHLTQNFFDLSNFKSSKMLHPFQCLLFCTLATDDSPSFLLAASRASVYVFAAADGTLLSTWRSSQDQAVIPEFGKSIAERSEDQDPSNRPSKRQKKASPDNASDSSSAEIVTEDGPSRPRKSKKTKITESNVVNLVATSDGQSIAVVTDEDKCVRVLRLDGKGRLQQLSQRQDCPCDSTVHRLSKR